MAADAKIKGCPTGEEALGPGAEDRLTTYLWLLTIDQSGKPLIARCLTLTLLFPLLAGSAVCTITESVSVGSKERGLGRL